MTDSNESERPEDVNETLAPSLEPVSSKDHRLEAIRERQKDRRQLLGTYPIRRLILLKLGTPSLIAMGSLAIYNLVDALIVSNSPQGTTAAAALSVGSIIEVFSIALAFVLGIGANSIISAAMGRGDFATAELTFATLLTISLVIAVLFCACIFPFADQIAVLMGASEVVRPSAAHYIRIACSNFLFHSFQISGNNVLRSSGEAILALISNVSAAVVNCIFDVVFVIVMDLGAPGACYATVCGTGVAGLVAMYPILAGKTALRLRWKDMLPSKKGARISLDILRFGLPQGLGQLADGCSSLFANIFISRVALDSTLGDSVIASFGVAQKLARLVQQIVNGINQAFLPVASFSHTAGQPRRFRAALKVTLAFALSWAATISVIVLTTSKWLPQIFNKDPLFVQVCTSVLLSFFSLISVYALASPINFGLQVVGKQNISIVLTTWRRFLGYIPATFVVYGCMMATHTPARSLVSSVYYSLPLAEGTAAIASITVALVYRRELHLVPSLDRAYCAVARERLAAAGADTSLVEPDTSCCESPEVQMV